MSAFGQEPWAQRELWKLRREYPEWAFLVVRYRWLALRGEHTVIAAAGPDALRMMLSETSNDRFLSGAVSAVDHTEPSVVGTGAVDGSGGARLSGTVAVGGAGMGVLPARRSGTGTWAAVPRPVRRTGWGSWRWPWSRRRARHARRRTEPKEQPAGGRPRVSGRLPLAVG